MGNSIIDDGVEMEVVWDGGELLPPRATIPDLTWEPPRRLYNRKETPPTVLVGGNGVPDATTVVEVENVMPTIEVNEESVSMAMKFMEQLNETLGSLQVQNEAILERLDDLETKIDNLNLYQNDGYGEVDGL